MQSALAAFGLQAQADDPALIEAQAPPEPVCEVWPEHRDALQLFLACQGQLQQLIGGMGGARWRGAQAVNVAQEARWLGIAGRQQAPVVRQYREIEAEALRILNEREVQAARESSRKR